MFTGWIKYAIGEGLTKTASFSLQKFVGFSFSSLGGVLIATTIIGVVQCLGGFVGAVFKKESLFPDIKLILGSLWFGIFAFIATVAGFWVFTYKEADVGIATFFITFGIVPGALADWIFFGNKLQARQWLGILIFLGSGYAVLDFPPLSSLISLPTWVLIVLLISLTNVANEVITRFVSISPISNPFVNNFWIGLTTIALGISGSLLFGNIASNLESISNVLLFSSVMIGVIVLVMISLKLLAYKAGGTIALKKIVMMGTFLTTAMIVSTLIFGTPFTVGKAVATIGFLAAFIFIDQETWIVFWKKVKFAL